ncbi:MAG: SCO family protein [Gemmatimonadetes bacterium]|nr:SCO family protein [Gemmatimonadota bacterium]MBI2401668.1 SCO family protein [Gemmatimonadota bacterium]MBI2537723.1 SCO family protein [Gemmatimonadota bacterium]
MSPSILSLLVAGTVSGGLAACAAGSANREPQDLNGYLLGEPLAKPEVTLTSTDGTPFDFRQATDGFVTLVFFGYTNCPDICPVHMSNLGSVLATLDPRVAERIKVVFVTTDPRRDTPAVVRAWLDHFSRSFIGLTGDSITIARAQESLQLAPAVIQKPAAADTGYAVGHSALVVAFTADNLAHVVYPFGTRQEDWAQDLPQLVREGWGRR